LLIYIIIGEIDEICNIAIIEKSRNSRYNNKKFQGIIINIGAIDKSTIKYRQYKVYIRLAKITIDISIAEQAKFKFGINITFSKGIIDVEILFGIIQFHIIDTDTPFLISLADIDRLKIYLNNIINILISTIGAISI
jgi:hypothetical protein